MYFCKELFFVLLVLACGNISAMENAFENIYKNQHYEGDFTGETINLDFKFPNLFQVIPVGRSLTATTGS